MHLQKLHMGPNENFLDMRSTDQLVSFVLRPLQMLGLTYGHKPPSVWLLLGWLEHPCLPGHLAVGSTLWICAPGGGDQQAVTSS